MMLGHELQCTKPYVLIYISLLMEHACVVFVCAGQLLEKHTCRLDCTCAHQYNCMQMMSYCTPTYIPTLIVWVHTWLMEFNIKKCEHLRITNKRNPIIHSYQLENSIISEIPHTKYLGVTIDQKLSWNEHIQRVTSKANRVNGFLHHNLHQCPVSVKNNCYKMMVRPIVEYASSVWAPHTIIFSRFSSVKRMMSSLNCHH